MDMRNTGFFSKSKKTQTPLELAAQFVQIVTAIKEDKYSSSKECEFNLRNNHFYAEAIDDDYHKSEAVLSKIAEGLAILNEILGFNKEDENKKPLIARATLLLHTIYNNKLFISMFGSNVDNIESCLDSIKTALYSVPPRAVLPSSPR